MYIYAFFFNIHNFLNYRILFIELLDVKKLLLLAIYVVEKRPAGLPMTRFHKEQLKIEVVNVGRDASTQYKKKHTCSPIFLWHE